MPTSPHSVLSIAADPVDAVSMILLIGASAVGCGELQLNVVRVTEGQNIQTEITAQILYLAVWHPMLIQAARCLVERLPAAHTETQMIEPDTVLVESIVGDRPVGSGAHAEEELPISE